MNRLNINLIIILSLTLIGIIYFPNAYSKIQFQDITEYSGISYSGFSYGSSWGDFNEDGFPDLWTGNHGSHGNGSELFINNADGTFRLSENLGIYNFSNHDIHTATWVDFDNDGDDDLMIMSGASGGEGQGKNLFLVNNKGIFEEKAKTFGLDDPFGRGRNALWFDWNNDGLLDVVLNNFPRDDGKSPTSLYIQNKTEFTKIFEFNNIQGTQSAQISKLLNNNWMLIILNPYSEGIYKLDNTPFKNIYSELQLQKHTSNDLVISDFNNDLTLDIFRSTGAWEDNAFQNDLLDFNENNTKFSIMNKKIISEPTSCIGAVSGDFDNDMDVDIYIVCGIWGKIISGTSKSRSDENLQNIILENLGDGNFVKITTETGAEGTPVGVGETVSVVDYDNDGFLDLFVTNGGGWIDFRKGGPHQLFKNIGNENNWLEIDLIGTKSNRNGIGTRLFLEIDDSVQIREQTDGVHFRAQNHQRIHFGLAENEMVDRIIIYWPSGIVHALENVFGNQILQITEPPQPIPPKHQMDLGVYKTKIMCKDGLNLLINSKMNKAACVKISSWDILKERGW